MENKVKQECDVIPQEMKVSRRRIKFSQYGIKVGTTLTFLPTGSKAKVYDNSNVTNDDGRPVSPSTYVREHMPEGQRKRHWDGLKYFAVGNGDVPIADARWIVKLNEQLGYE
jgi:hypothetical protein